MRMENSNYKSKNIEEKYSNSWYDWLNDYSSEPIGNCRWISKIKL